MKRAFAIAVLLVAVFGAALTSAGAGGGDEALRYKIVFDDAFGVVEGADFKVGGVPVGAVETLDVERSSSRAIVTVTAEDTGFGGLRSDARCAVAPQSLIGEYFVDCQPGTDGTELASGDTIPVEQTKSPIPADLVGNVLRKPYRERLRLILNELGVGLAARGPDLNETIRRAVPALTETNEVLEVLGDNRRTLQALARDGGEVMKVLGERREDVGDFVVEAGDAAEATAVRRDELAETIRELPPFLDQLEPTLAELETTATQQTPALRDLRAASGSLTRVLTSIGPFTASARTATDALGEASVIGRRAVREATSTIEGLRRLGVAAPEPLNNLEFVLRDLDDRGRAVEADKDSPEGKGYTGFEAIAQYLFDQSMAANIYDQRGYSLKLNALANTCSSYTDAAAAKADPERTAKCSQALGPNQPGINQPDPSGAAALARRTGTGTRGQVSRPTADEDAGGGGTGHLTPRPTADPTATPRVGVPAIDELLDSLPDLGGDAPRSSDPVAPLLDFLLG